MNKQIFLGSIIYLFPPLSSIIYCDDQLLLPLLDVFATIMKQLLNNRCYCHVCFCPNYRVIFIITKYFFHHH